MYVCMYVCIYIYTYIYICIFKELCIGGSKPKSALYSSHSTRNAFGVLYCNIAW